MDPSSQAQCAAHCSKETPPWVSVFQRTGFFPPVLRPQLWWFNLPNRLLQYIGSQWSTPCMGMWGLIIAPLPKNHSYADTITHLIIEIVEWTIQHSCNREHAEGNPLDCVNLKGILRDVPICDATSSIRLWVVSHSFPPWDNGVKEASLWSLVPALSLTYPLRDASKTVTDAWVIGYALISSCRPLLAPKRLDGPCCLVLQSSCALNTLSMDAQVNECHKNQSSIE